MNEVLGVGLRRSNVMASTAGSSRLDLFHSFGCLDFYEIKKKKAEDGVYPPYLGEVDRMSGLLNQWQQSWKTCE